MSGPRLDRGRILFASMLGFVVLFYGAAILTHQREQAHPSADPGPVRQERLTREEVRDRETRLQQYLAREPHAAASGTLGFLLIFLTGLGVNLYWLIKRSGGDRVFGPERVHPAVPWKPSDVFRLVVFLFFVEAVLLIAEGLVAGAFGIRSIDHNLLLMSNSLARDIFVALAVLWLVKRSGFGWSAIGLERRGFWKHLRTGVVAYFGIVPVLLVIVLAMAMATKLLSYEPPPQPVVEVYLKEHRGHWIVYFTLFVAGAGPLIEEIFFRGFSYRAFRSRLGPRWAGAASALVFAALHLNLIAFVPIFVLGLYLAYLYERTGSIVPSMTVHVIHNFLMVALTLLFKNLTG